MRLFLIASFLFLFLPIAVAAQGVCDINLSSSLPLDQQFMPRTRIYFEKQEGINTNKYFETNVFISAWISKEVPRSIRPWNNWAMLSLGAKVAPKLNIKDLKVDLGIRFTRGQQLDQNQNSSRQAFELFSTVFFKKRSNNRIFLSGIDINGIAGNYSPQESFGGRANIQVLISSRQTILNLKPKDISIFSSQHKMVDRKGFSYNNFFSFSVGGLKTFRIIDINLECLFEQRPKVRKSAFGFKLSVSKFIQW